MERWGTKWVKLLHSTSGNFVCTLLCDLSRCVPTKRGALRHVQKAPVEPSQGKKIPVPVCSLASPRAL